MRGIETEGDHFVLAEGSRFLAAAKFAAKALGHDGAHGAGDEKGFDPDVDETGDGARGVVGVEGGKYQVAGEGRIDRNARGLEIADLTNHDDVRSLTQDGAEGAGEGHADVGFDMDLVDPGHDIFDRVLDRDDLTALVVDLRKAGVKCGGFTRSGGTGDEDDAIGHFDQAAEILLVVGHETDIRESDRKR